ncbi:MULTISPECIES: SRPBCC family protein [Ramlibacter]|uniref:SRPBCC family protein n=1 Tax=Ramlibacter pinisoli TaxID=2682844 RepID=A0A6N8IYZ8_9BURK|nr:MULTISPECIES: SRPBCC family protein [Ramlibacter]MBA2962045.1 SRPBCC family protein [Ramlibacter sp. CGMCC 1.13660]MVQ31988.1 SRPBCC family protein [Ramlibacter pinisoli]
MASLRHEIAVAAAPAAAWDAVRDFGALPTRLVPGFVTASAPEDEGAVRRLTFANGLQLRERLVTCDDAARRLVYTAIDGRTTHYNAAVQVQDAPGGGSLLVWTVDLLPDALAPAIDAMMALGTQAMRRALG